MYMDADDAERANSGGHDYYAWFTDYVQIQFTRLPHELKRLGLEKNDTDGIVVRDLNLADFHRILCRIFEFLGKKPHASIETIIVDLLGDEGLLFPRGEQTNELRHFVFACLGIATLLFKPLLPPKAGLLSIDAARKDLNRSHPTATRHSYEQPLAGARGFFIDVISRFGHPRGITCLQVQEPLNPEIQTIVPSELNFYHLYRLGGIKICCVDSLCQHLEFNKRDKTLMVFQHPSYCAMLSFGKGYIYFDQQA